MLLKLPSAREAMHTELKRNLLIGTSTFPDRYSELDGFEIHEVRRQLVLRQIPCRTHLVKMHLTSERDLLHTPLFFVEQSIRYVAQFAQSVSLDVRFQRFVLGSWQPMQGLFHQGLVALAIGEESTLIGGTALLTG